MHKLAARVSPGTSTYFRSMGKVTMRGVVEFTNTCHRKCLYCGMRASNTSLRRYELSGQQIVESARRAANMGVSILMIQGGDHLLYDLNMMCDAIAEIECTFGLTVMLCIGDRPAREYERLFAAGAREAIVKFETSNNELYRRMRPHGSLDQRLELIRQLNAIGYRISSGFIQGLPGSTMHDLLRDIDLIFELPVFAASVSPFIPGADTPLEGFCPPLLDNVLKTITEIRRRGPGLLIPTVSALNILSEREGRGPIGQLLGLKAGANVITVNLSPGDLRNQYLIYSRDRWCVEQEYARDLILTAGMELADPGEYLFAARLSASR